MLRLLTNAEALMVEEACSKAASSRYKFARKKVRVRLQTEGGGGILENVPRKEV